MARNRSSEQKRIAKGKPFITAGDVRRFGQVKTRVVRIRNQFMFAKSPLTPGQIYFMRFVGVRTNKAWLIDDDYKRWTKEMCRQRFALRRMWEEGAARMRLSQT